VFIKVIELVERLVGWREEMEIVEGEEEGCGRNSVAVKKVL
jgi:hypothetical protein